MLGGNNGKLASKGLSRWSRNQTPTDRRRSKCSTCSIPTTSKYASWVAVQKLESEANCPLQIFSAQSKIRKLSKMKQTLCWKKKSYTSWWSVLPKGFFRAHCIISSLLVAWFIPSTVEQTRKTRQHAFTSSTCTWMLLSPHDITMPMGRPGCWMATIGPLSSVVFLLPLRWVQLEKRTDQGHFQLVRNV